MEQDCEGGPEEALVLELYNLLRTHLDRSVKINMRALRLEVTLLVSVCS